MSQTFDDQQQPDNFTANKQQPYKHDDVERYYQANLEIESNRHYIEETRQQITELEHSESVELFQKQVGLLQKRLLNDPQFFQEMFITEGTSAISWQFQQKQLDEKFTHTFWNLLLRNDDMSSLLLRFIWNLPLDRKSVV